MSRGKTYGKLTRIGNIGDIITLFGLKPFDDIDIVFIGMRHGRFRNFGFRIFGGGRHLG